jgi:hypothetical protein
MPEHRIADEAPKRRLVVGIRHRFEIAPGQAVAILLVRVADEFVERIARLRGEHVRVAVDRAVMSGQTTGPDLGRDLTCPRTTGRSPRAL